MPLRLPFLLLPWLWLIPGHAESRPARIADMRRTLEWPDVGIEEGRFRQFLFIRYSVNLAFNFCGLMEEILAKNDVDAKVSAPSILSRILPVWISAWFPTPAIPESRPIHDTSTSVCSLLSHALFLWPTRYVRLAALRELHVNDIEQLDPADKSFARSERFRSLLASKTNFKDGASLLSPLSPCFARKLISAAMLTVLSGALQVTHHAIFYRLFIRYLIRSEAHAKGLPYSAYTSFAYGVGLVAASFAIMSFARILASHSEYQFAIVAGQVRTLLISLIFEKSFKVSTFALRKRSSVVGSEDNSQDTWTTGAILALMNTDAERVQLAINGCSALLSFLIIMPFAIGYGFWLIGWPSLVAFGAMLASLPCSMAFTKIRFIKIYCWEDLFSSRVTALRNQETHHRQVIVPLSAAGTSILEVSSLLGTVGAITVYSLVRDISNSETIITFAVLCNLVINYIWPVILKVGLIMDARLSLDRVTDFLLATEPREGVQYNVSSAYAIDMQPAKFNWQIDSPSTAHISNILQDRIDLNSPGLDSTCSPKYSPKVGSTDHSNVRGVLSPIDLKLGSSELVAVVGPVNCGKSSLLSAIAGEMEYVSGVCQLKCRPAFCPQVSWIQSATVRENIVFGESWDPDKYNRIVAACALVQDLKQLEMGDLTVLGERGVTISGGQKQRINLARTMYQDSAVVLLDDPLSAIDVVTGNHVFAEAIMKEMSNKCRILVTHQLHFLSKCDKIIWMSSGTIIRTGTFEELLQTEPDFARFVGHCSQKNDTANSSEPEFQGEIMSDSVTKPIFAEKVSYDEECAVNSVPLKLYKDYLLLGSSLLWISILLGISASSQTLNSLLSVAPAWWSSDKFNITNGSYIAIIFSFLGGNVILWFVFAQEFQKVFIRSSNLLSRSALHSVLNAPISFYDINPAGRIMNRFTQDINNTDSVLPRTAWAIILYPMILASITGLLVSYLPVVAAIVLPWTLLVIFILMVYKRTPLAIKRLEVTRLSIVVSKFSEGLSGRLIIRSTGRQQDFTSVLHQSIDALNSIHFLSFATSQWMAVAQSWVSGLFYFAVGVLVVSKRNSIAPAIGLILFSESSFIGLFIQNIFTEAGTLQRSMNSVERLKFYATDIDQEGARRVVSFNAHAEWPNKCRIIFENVVLRYRSGLPLSLAGVSMTIQDGEKIGIVGRTGAGKSSILVALLRIVELESGNISINGVNIRSMGLYDLRNQLAVIPQDPTLFSGTVRTNLDPFERVQDMALNKALRQSTLTDSSKIEADFGSVHESLIANTSSPSSKCNDHPSRSICLDTEIEAGGTNLSQGERQLMALARAMVRDARIIISDEATSSVDLETDHKIQQVLRHGFHDKTVISIAHRIQTVIKYDKICVLECGRVAEFDTPLALFHKPDSIFRSMCDRSNVVESMMS